MQTFRRRIVSMLRSERFFYFVLILFAFQAVWFAISAIYPMAFDENFHFGLIKIYANQWGPFLTSPPPFSGEFGPLTRDNSYFYHYVMSFPFRLIRLLVTNQEGQIILLRLLNIGLFAGGIVLFRKLLFKTKASRALIHFALFASVLIPVTPMLAAHINYDNLVFLLTPIILLLTLHCARQLKRSGTFPLATFTLLTSICFVTSIVKYAFLPIFLALFLYFVLIIFRLPKPKRLLFIKRLWPDIRKLSVKMRVGLALVLLLSGGLFIERYGINLVQYHSLVPECSEVISIEHCSHYGPWARNQTMEKTLAEKPAANLVAFNLDWFNGMLFRLFFAINTDYNTQPPLILPFTSAYLVALPGLALLAWYGWRLMKKDRVLVLFLVVIVIYGLSIYGNNLKSYLSLGELTAVNGRYFLPLMPLIFLVVGLAFREWFQRFKQPFKLKIIAAVVATFLLLQGGGLMTFLIRSQPDWYWQSQPIIALNEIAKTIVSYLVLIKY